jgi:sialic acid synthase SpsE
MKAGDTFTKENLRSIRPAMGLHPRNYETVLGKTARKAIEAGTPLSEEHFDA